MPPQMNAQMGGAYQQGPPPAPFNAQMGGPLPAPFNAQMGGPPPPPFNAPMGGPFQPPPPPGPGYGPPGGMGGGPSGPSYSGVGDLYGNGTGYMMPPAPMTPQSGMFNEYVAPTDPGFGGASADRATSMHGPGQEFTGGTAAEPWLNEFGGGGAISGGQPSSNPSVNTNSRYGGAENVGKSSIEQSSKQNSRYGAAAYRSKPDLKPNDSIIGSSYEPAKTPLVEIPKNLFQKSERPGFVAPAVKERFTNYEVGGDGKPRVTKEEMLRNLNTRNYDVAPSKSTSSVSNVNEAQSSSSSTKRSSYLSSTEPTKTKYDPPSGIPKSSISASSIPASNIHESGMLTSETQGSSMSASGTSAGGPSDSGILEATNVLDAKIQELKSLSNRLAELQELLSKNTQITQPIVPTTTLAPTKRTTTATTTTSSSTTTTATTSAITTAAATTSAETTAAATTEAATTAAAAPRQEPVVSSQSYSASNSQSSGRYSSVPQDTLTDTKMQQLWEMYLNMTGGQADVAAGADPLGLIDNSYPSQTFDQSQTALGGSVYPDQFAGSTQQATTQSWLDNMGTGYAGTQQVSAADALTGAAGYEQQGTSNVASINTLQSLSNLLGGTNAAFDQSQIAGALSGAGYDAALQLAGRLGTETGTYDPAATNYVDPAGSVMAPSYDTNQHMPASQGYANNNFDATTLLTQNAAPGAAPYDAGNMQDLAQLASQLAVIRANYHANQQLQNAMSPVSPAFDTVQQSAAAGAYDQTIAGHAGYDAAGYNSASQAASGYDYAAAQGQASQHGYDQWPGSGYETQGTGYNAPSSSYSAQSTAYDTAAGAYSQDAYYNTSTAPPMNADTYNYINDLKSKMLQSIKAANSRKNESAASSSGVSWQQHRWQEMSAQKTASKGPLPAQMKTAISKIAEKLTQSMSSLSKNDSASPMSKKTIMSALQNIAAGITKRQITKRSSPAPRMLEMHDNGIKIERILKPALDMAVGNATENVKYISPRESQPRQQFNAEQLIALRRRFELLRKLKTVIEARKARQILMQQPVQESTPSASDLFPGSAVSVETMQIIQGTTPTESRHEPLTSAPPNETSYTVESQANKRAAVLQQLAALLHKRAQNNRLSAGQTEAIISQVVNKTTDRTVDAVETTAIPPEVTTSAVPPEPQMSTESPGSLPQSRAAVIRRLKSVLEMRRALNKFRLQQKVVGDAPNQQSKVIVKPSVPLKQDKGVVPVVQQPPVVAVPEKVATTVTEKEASAEPLPLTNIAAPSENTNSNNNARGSNVIVMPLNREMLMRVLHTIRNKQNNTPTR